jgi:hypothetical protein
MRAERRRGKALGEPYEGEPHVRFDEGVLETELRRRLNGHEAGNGGHSQGEASRHRASALLCLRAVIHGSREVKCLPPGKSP